MKPTNDGEPLFSAKHERQEGWGFKISRFEWINNIFDFFYMLIKRPKLTESHLEKINDPDCGHRNLETERADWKNTKVLRSSSAIATMGTDEDIRKKINK